MEKGKGNHLKAKDNHELHEIHEREKTESGVGWFD
jgi:hypothetical protein